MTLRPRKPKPTEPSLRDKLSASFMKAFEADFQTYGAEVIEQLREKHPDRYVEVAARLIATLEPKSDSWDDCQSWEDMGNKLLRSAGVEDPDRITPDMIARALEANNRFVDELAQIAQEAIQ
jgi:hypothetical protein